MTKRMNWQAPVSPFDVRMLWDNNGLSLEFAEKAYRAWLDGTLRIQNEAMNFWQSSTGKNWMAATDIAKCATASEAFEMQSKYAQDRFTELLGEGRRMVEMLGELVNENATMFNVDANSSTAKGAKR